MSAGIGHNGGPSMEPGFGFRKHAWKRARQTLLPVLPLQIVRIRVERARRLGLDYRTYATIRATTGNDIVAFLFSGNALELTRQRIRVPGALTARITAMEECDRIAAVHIPNVPDQVLAANCGALDFAARAPAMTESWGNTRDRLVAILKARGVRSRETVLISATAVEREWSGAAKLAGLVSADRYFQRIDAR